MNRVETEGDWVWATFELEKYDFFAPLFLSASERPQTISCDIVLPFTQCGNINEYIYIFFASICITLLLLLISLIFFSHSFSPHSPITFEITKWPLLLSPLWYKILWIHLLHILDGWKVSAIPQKQHDNQKTKPSPTLASSPQRRCIASPQRKTRCTFFNQHGDHYKPRQSIHTMSKCPIQQQWWFLLTTPFGMADFPHTPFQPQRLLSSLDKMHNIPKQPPH